MVEYEKIEVCGSVVHRSSHNGTDFRKERQRDEGTENFRELCRELQKAFKAGLLEQNPDMDATEKEEKRRSDSVRRTRETILKLAQCNMTKFSKFITLTYKREETDLCNAKEDLKAFIRSMREKAGFRCHYIAIPEIQEERRQKYGCAVWHWHVIFFTNKYIDFKLVRAMWGQGGTHVTACTNDNVAYYVSKYITKGKIDTIKGQFCITSKGLKKPKVYRKINPFPSRGLYLKSLSARIGGWGHYSYTIVNNVLALLGEGEKCQYKAADYFKFFGGAKAALQGFSLVTA